MGQTEWTTFLTQGDPLVRRTLEAGASGRSSRSAGISSSFQLAAGRRGVPGVPEEQIDRLELCLNEVLANLGEHGGDAEASHAIQLELGASPVPGGAQSCRYPAGRWPESSLRPAIELKPCCSTAAIC
jgi:hypothetical protein